MPRKKRKPRIPEEEHTHLAVRVTSHEASAGAAVNHNVYAPQYARNVDDDDPLYEFTAHLVISGIATYPEDRAGETYELTIYGNDAPSRRLDATLKDAQVRDRYDAPQYRPYRGRQIPVYDPPKGIGHLDKIRGEPRWAGRLFVRHQFVSDALALLALGKTLYLAIHERKEKRARWIQGLMLQTADPENE